MGVPPSCPRCGGELHPPGPWSSAWLCDSHGQVHPWRPASRPCTDSLRVIQQDARVPIWLPWPLPDRWLVTGYARAGDDRTGAVASAVACSGPAPLGGPADLVLIAEELGVGAGARYAGLHGPDPGAGFDVGPPHAKVHAYGHPLPLWSIDAGPDRAVFVGEALGRWLWAVLWPAEAGVLMVEPLTLADLRDTRHALDIPYGAPSPRLTS